MFFSTVVQLFGTASSRRAAAARLTLCELEPRALPSTFLWSPSGAVVPSSTAWSAGDNWLIYNPPATKYVEQTTSPKLTPGAGDSVEFNGSSTRANSDCVVDVGGGVTVKEISVYSGFSKNMILTNPLKVSGGNSLLRGSAATIRGSSPGAPAARGTLTITDQSMFQFVAGGFEDVTVAVGGESNLVVDGSTGTRRITGSDISVGDTAKLVWFRGDVNVTNNMADSNISISSGGNFTILAANSSWAMSTPTSPAYFRVVNNGTVRLDAPGTATIVGDYLTDGLTRLDSGILSIQGLAEQTGGTFELRGNTTVQVGGNGNTLGIRSGMIVGQGTVEANLVLGYDGPCPPPGGGTISPGIDIVPSSPGAAPIVYGIGTITVTGAFQIFSGGMNIDYDAAGNYDKVIVQGQYAALSGSLQVRGDDTYRPTQPVTMAFLTAATITGDFYSTTSSGMGGWMAPNGMDMIVFRIKKYATSYVIETYTPPRP